MLFRSVLLDPLYSPRADIRTRITSLMVSRLMLNLRVRTPTERSPRTITTHGHTRAGLSFTVTRSAKDNFIDTVIGNLGEPVDSYWIDSETLGDSEGEIEVVPRDVELAWMSRDRAIQSGYS